MHPLVLIIDSQPQCRLYELVADRIGITTQVVQGFNEAIAAISTTDFALILTDWILADGDGLECQRRIREKLITEDRPVPPIICVTARAMLGYREKCLNAGMDDYLAKPFTIEQLNDIIHKWL